MAGENVFSTADNLVGNLNGLFKQVYADNLKDLIPDGVKLYNMIKFNSKHKTGDLYNQPVILGMEHGVTFAADTDDAFTLEDAVQGAIKNASVRGNALVLRSRIGYKAISASMGSEAAFESATKYLVTNMLRSITKKLEIELLYGQAGYATVASAVGAVVTIPAAQWAPGIWAGAEGMPVDIRDVTGVTSRLVATILSVNFDNRTITLSADAAAAGVVATDVIHHKGAYGNEFVGIHNILLLQTGTLFGISRTTYQLFRGNVYTTGGDELSFDHLNMAVSRAVEKGLDSEVKVLINPRTWADLLTEQSALRHYDSSYSSKQFEQGAEGLVFHSQNGKMEIIPSIYVKEGFAYMLDVSTWMRVGSQEVDFIKSGHAQGEYFTQLPDVAGYELRCYADQALFCNAPSRNVIIQGIVNNQ